MNEEFKKLVYMRAKRSTAPFYCDEKSAVAILKNEFVVMKERNATEDEWAAWRERITGRFPEHQRDQLLEKVREGLEGKGIGA
jgi:hypothetical protein